VGHGPFFRFPKFEAAAVAEDWLTMAHACKISEAGNPGIIPRNVRNGLLFTIANWMAAPSGEFSALVFDRSLKLDENMRSGNFPIPLNLAIGVQTALETLGFDPNGLDGLFGRGARTALTQFQSDNSLRPTPNATMIDDVPQETIDALAFALDANGVDHFP
jgi:Putative peptidoglycan binding domain